MVKSRLVLIGVLIGVALVASACYKDAGENVEPTSNRVNLSDIQPTTPATPTLLIPVTPTPIDTPVVGDTPTRTLVPTTTPFVAVTSTSAVVTNTPPLVAPSFTPVVTTSTLGITTPGMSDILPTFTPVPTIDPAFQPTNTPIPPEENPCLHVVQPNDTLYSIATANDVDLTALVAANPSLLGGSEYTTLQIGWQLQLPGCGVVEPTAQPTEAGGAAAPEQPIDIPAGGTTTHTVQPGETIYAIARQYNVDPQAIIDANPLTDPNRINPGDTLIIPAAP